MMIFGITGSFMLLDILTGLIKAFKNKAYTSTLMREGLFHKCGFILCILLAVMVDYTQHYMDLGLPINITPVLCAYIILNEIGSTIENIGEITPELLPDQVKSYFGKLSGGGKDE